MFKIKLTSIISILMNGADKFNMYSRKLMCTRKYTCASGEVQAVQSTRVT